MLNFGAPTLYAKLKGTKKAMQLGIVQDCSLEISRDLKELFGQFAYPVAIGKGQGKCSGSFTIARFNPQLFNLALGGSYATGGFDVVKEDSLLTPTGLEIVTKNAVSDDLGVVLTGDSEQDNVQMNCVDTTPTQSGEYSFDGTKYTFHADDATKIVEISYQYPVISGSTIEITNELMGHVTTFKLLMVVEYDGLKTVYQFPNALSGKFSLPFKKDDFNTAQLDYAVAADGRGKLLQIYNIPVAAL